MCQGTIGVLLVLLLLCACSNGKAPKSLAEQASAADNYETTEVHAMQQALPSLMVIPSDNLLSEYGAMSNKTNEDGRKHVLRDYQHYL